MLSLLLAIAALVQAPDRIAGMREDLDFFASELPKHHLNAFHTISKERFAGDVKAVSEELPGLSDLQFRLRLIRLAASIGDAHTTVAMPLDGHRYFPLSIGWFPDGVFITASDAAHADLIGSRVLAVDGTGSEKLTKVAGGLVSSENKYWTRAMVPQALNNATLLHALGATKAEQSAKFDLQPPKGGRQGALIESVVGTGASVITAYAWPPERIPLRNQNTAKRYWSKLLAKEHAVYFAYNSCRDEAEYPFKESVAEAIKWIDEGKADRLVVDLRRNGGGNSSVIDPLFQAIQSRVALNRKDRLFVLIGPRTFSSAMMNAVQFRKHTNATLVGESTGGKPNSYGEVKSFLLPNSKLVVSYCTKYFKQIADGDPEAVAPDVIRPILSRDYFAGTDPGLEFALKRG
jgi:hypothetical protein